MVTGWQANIFYDPRGEIKLGDFGLAKFERGGSDAAEASSPTATGAEILPKPTQTHSHLHVACSDPQCQQGTHGRAACLSLALAAG